MDIITKSSNYLMAELFAFVFAVITINSAHPIISNRSTNKELFFLKRNIKLFNSPTRSITDALKETPNRKHKNKYIKFSNKLEDPILASIKSAKEAHDTASLDTSSPVRGTTVPNIYASPSVVNKTVYKNVSQIFPSDPYTFGYVRIGVISGPHGVKGEVKVQMETDFAEYRALPGSILYVKRPHRRSPRPVRVASGRRQQGNTFLMSFERIKSRLGAEAFRNFIIYSKLDDRPELCSNEYLIRDLVGLQCYLLTATSPGESKEAGLGSTLRPDPSLLVAEVVGVVSPEDLCEPSAAKFMHAMLEVKLRCNGELCLIPLVPQIVVTVNTVQGWLVLDPPGGLLDISYPEPQEKIVIRGYLPSAATLSEDQRRDLLAWMRAGE